MSLRTVHYPTFSFLGALMLSTSLSASYDAGEESYDKADNQRRPHLSKRDVLPDIDLAAFTAAEGFRIDGVAANTQSGVSVSNAGDINNDGIGDVIVGA